jgi:hypothetical protein
VGLAIGMPGACWRSLGAACGALSKLGWRLRLGLGEGARATSPFHTAPRQLAQRGAAMTPIPISVARARARTHTHAYSVYLSLSLHLARNLHGNLACGR